ncbi:uncharacterized protein BO88DRAFT_441805 [Aspergillus vadensis CBS 113365]|uniref:Uncharacterized protein n=1 Tax=Aspergillus vadensis (strain CBS 113365 / IMI 142717 / IBT 24658) TaxID=1448311 RepID=A0A319BJ12_ASPVC|nr:hypothetical protein BO88DRAFT_441805 [Aspergillus vadensis CBS 113365]PYH72214.1 hypothetical protein BO88DRAFT_441805 [Aspergillus vadensis CBS 113365]
MGNGKIDSFSALCRRKKWMGATRPAMRRPFLAPSGVSTGCLFNNRQDEAAVVAGKADVLEGYGIGPSEAETIDAHPWIGRRVPDPPGPISLARKGNCYHRSLRLMPEPPITNCTPFLPSSVKVAISTGPKGPAAFPIHKLTVQNQESPNLASLTTVMGLVEDTSHIPTRGQRRS